MSEHIGIATVLIILAVAGGLGDDRGPTDAAIAAGPDYVAPR